jgi:hypothetical protein
MRVDTYPPGDKMTLSREEREFIEQNATDHPMDLIAQCIQQGRLHGLQPKTILKSWLQVKEDVFNVMVKLVAVTSKETSHANEG